MQDLPTLGIRFDIDKVLVEEDTSYGRHCWKVVWRAVDAACLRGREVMLFDGDTRKTLQGGQTNVFCTAMQCSDATVFDGVRTALEGSEHFCKLAASPMFLENADVVGEPLMFMGAIGSNGKFAPPPGQPFTDADPGSLWAERSQESQGAQAPAQRKWWRRGSRG
jgi:hypothetical protein